MQDTSSLRPGPTLMVQPIPYRPQPIPRGLARPGYGKMPGIRGLPPIGVIEEGWAMSVGRLAGAGTEAARGNGPQRARAKRAAAERTIAERTKAERATAEGAAAESATAEPTT